MGSDAVPYRLDEHSRRLDGHHKRIGAIEVNNADQDRAIALIEHDVGDLDEKVDEIKMAISKSDEKRQAENERARRAFYTAAAFLATLSVSIMGLIAVLLQSH